MPVQESLKHPQWECKYQVVFIPKYRRKVLSQQLRRDWGGMFRELCRHKECQAVAGHLMGDQVPRLVSMPPKYSVSQIMGCVKGKSAIHLARTYEGRKRRFVGMHFWARGYWVSTAGRDEQAVRKHIQEQEPEDKRLEQRPML